MVQVRLRCQLEAAADSLRQQVRGVAARCLSPSWPQQGLRQPHAPPVGAADQVQTAQVRTVEVCA